MEHLGTEAYARLVTMNCLAIQGLKENLLLVKTALDRLFENAKLRWNRVRTEELELRRLLGDRCPDKAELLAASEVPAGCSRVGEWCYD